MKSGGIAIRPETPADIPLVRSVNLRAFGGADEATLVDRLREEKAVIASLVAEDAGGVVGHILFSRVFIESGTSAVAAASLAPTAVAPERQRQRIGSMLVRAGLDVCRAQGERIVVVVGHPEYYPAFGFSHSATANLRNPYTSGPAFMALELVPAALAGVTGDVRYPAAFDGVA